jgi:hypothetical protein
VSENTRLASLGQLGEVPKLVVEKVCSAIGLVYEPTHLRRIAEAKAHETRVMAAAETDASNIRARCDAHRG